MERYYDVYYEGQFIQRCWYFGYAQNLMSKHPYRYIKEKN